MSNLKKLSQDENIPEDEVKELQDKIQNLIDKFVININDLSKAKEEDILKI
jgi:ribosome recycling factor